MTIERYPIMKKLLSEETANAWHRPYSEQKMARLTEALGLWAQSKTDGGIENPRFVETKQIISRAVEDAWSGIARDHEWLFTLETKHREALDSIPHPNLSNLSGRLKRVAKAPDSPLRDTLLDLLTEIEPLSVDYTFLKANTRKRVVKSEEEREAERFVPPLSSSAAVAKVRNVLEQAIDRTYQGLLERHQLQNRKMIEAYIQARDKVIDASGNNESYTPLLHFSVTDQHGRRKVVNPLGVSFLEKVLNREQFNSPLKGYQYKYSTHDQTFVLSDNLAEQDTKLIRDQFLYKNLVKLTPLLEAKGDGAFDYIREIGEFDLERLEGEFEVKFKDSASFRLRNAVVFVVNQYDTHFCRFPTTFHDVIMPSGEPMPSPSEERMHEIFAPAVSVPSEQTEKPKQRKPR